MGAYDCLRVKQEQSKQTNNKKAWTFLKPLKVFVFFELY